jgi:hypothetical protein
MPVQPGSSSGQVHLGTSRSGCSWLAIGILHYRRPSEPAGGTLLASNPVASTTCSIENDTAGSVSVVAALQEGDQPGSGVGDST